MNADRFDTIASVVDREYILWLDGAIKMELRRLTKDETKIDQNLSSNYVEFFKLLVESLTNKRMDFSRYADDVVNDAFLRLFEKKEKPDFLFHYVLKAAYHKYLNIKRKERNNSRAFDRIKHWKPTQIRSLDDEVSKSDEVMHALKYLPDIERQIVRMHYFQHLDVEKIAIELELSQPRVYKLLKSARNTLGKILLYNECYSAILRGNTETK